MEESPKVYTSSSTDYNLASAPKTQISNHPKKKHSMVLNLGNKSSCPANAFGADQTPTPTRFIRNCEEVGLFQDLQNVNPFEETFRKAIEAGKSGSLALQNSRLSVVTDDTLHTPHVFPHIIENESSVLRTDSLLRAHERTTLNSGAGAGSSEVADERLRPAVKVIRQEADTSQLRPIAPSAVASHLKAGGEGSSTSLQPQPVQLILQMPDGRLMQLNATPLDSGSDKQSQLQGPVDLVARVDKTKGDLGSVILHTSPEKKQESDNISPLIKEKLKARLGNCSANIQQEKFHSSCEPIAGKVGQREEGVRAKRLSTMSNTSNSEDDEETKRRKFLERNRAAAMRCREKRKFWVATLERRAEQMLSTNQQLQLEVGALRAQVAHLKTLLLAHKDCPVTQAMCSHNNQGMTSSSPITFGAVHASPLILEQDIQVVKPLPLSADESAFRQNLKKKLRTVSVKKCAPEESKGNNRTEIPKKKRLSLDIESAKQSQCLSQKDSPLVRSDEYLSSTVLPTETPELESLREMSKPHKPVATQVIQVNPNVIFRDNSLRAASTSPTSPPPSTHCLHYS